MSSKAKSPLVLTRRNVIAAAPAAATLSLAGCAPAAHAQQRTNVIFIFADDLGFADLGCYGSRHIKTPNLDKLASEGALLTDCYANSPLCSPSRLALATGCYQQTFHTGLMEGFHPSERGETAIPTEQPTMQGSFQQAGYRTMLVGKWHLGPTPAGNPLNFGYDEFFGMQEGVTEYFSHRFLGKEVLMDGREVIEREGYLTDILTDRAIEFVETSEASSTPFFLSLHYNAPHWPWQAPDSEWSEENEDGVHYDGGSAEIYSRMVESMDANIGRLLRALSDIDAADNTIIVFTSDNGGERFSEVWPFRGMKGSLLEGGVRVPGIVRYPSAIPAGVTSSQPVLTMDWMPTLLEAAGISGASNKIDGLNLFPQIAGAKSVDRIMFWKFQGRQQQAAREGDWKYLQLGDDAFLFNLREDPLEYANCRAAEPERFKKLVDAWAEWNSRMFSEDLAGYCLQPKNLAGMGAITKESNCRPSR